MIQGYDPEGEAHADRVLREVAGDFRIVGGPTPRRPAGPGHAEAAQEWWDQVGIGLGTPVPFGGGSVPMLVPPIVREPVEYGPVPWWQKAVAVAALVLWFGAIGLMLFAALSGSLK